MLRRPCSLNAQAILAPVAAVVSAGGEGVERTWANVNGAECMALSPGDHLEERARNQLLQVLRDLPPPLERFVAMNDHAEGVDRLAVEQHVELDELAAPVREEFVVEGRVAARDRFQLVVKVENDFGERKLEVELDTRWIEILHATVHAAALLAQLHDAADVVGGNEDARLHK